jgi:hypothetical protein
MSLFDQHLQKAFVIGYNFSQTLKYVRMSSRGEAEDFVMFAKTQMSGSDEWPISEASIQLAFL